MKEIKTGSPTNMQVISKIFKLFSLINNTQTIRWIAIKW